ncbi:DUF2520 domain-containing protein [Cytophagales bacterium LB-30]|uniref:DUF2520 domain-containing protein n=1 Tax=Shiella aurantiaca TaxID=3058365 RepID=A0ABT8F2G2_9BACT|nr:Rossmann-like and DUF2520 domain-containing protein [Shiella aurantiaca]MDN4164612.1 DUF2520 domain-containing protein [Shiella aurantiaca]
MSFPALAFIGSGNVAWHLAQALENVGYPVKEVYSPNNAHAQALVERLYDARVVQSLDFSHSKAQIFIIAVSDAAIEEVAGDLVIPEDAIVVHTSGSMPLSKLGYVPTEHIGVFYPLQTFTKKHKVDFSQVPFCIETENIFTKKALFQLASSLSKKVLEVNYADRMKLHLAAVFACNFSNHMMAISEKILSEQGLDNTLLHPLIVETINKSLEIGASNAQTGPAKRGDLEVLDRHMDLLVQHPDWAQLYQIISQNILDTYR